MLSLYPAVGQCSLQLLDSGIGDLRASETERSQVGKTAQVLEARVRHLCVVEIEPFQIGQTAQVLEAGVTEMGATCDATSFLCWQF